MNPKTIARFIAKPFAAELGPGIFLVLVGTISLGIALGWGGLEMWEERSFLSMLVLMGSLELLVGICLFAVHCAAKAYVSATSDQK